MGRWHSGCIRWMTVSVAVAVVALASPRGAGAQEETVVVSGLVRDQTTNAPVSGVLVRIIERDLQVLTDADGRFAFAVVPPGTYTTAWTASDTKSSRTCSP